MTKDPEDSSLFPFVRSKRINYQNSNFVYNLNFSIHFQGFQSFSNTMHINEHPSSLQILHRTLDFWNESSITRH